LVTGTGIYALSEPTAAERTAFFSGLTHQLAQPPRPNLNRKRKALQPPQVRPLNPAKHSQCARADLLLIAFRLILLKRDQTLLATRLQIRGGV